MDLKRKVSALRAQKRNPERVNVYLDGEYAFSLARIVAAWLHVGQELSEDRIAQLLDRDSHEKAYQAALRLIGYRPRAEAEIVKKLTEQGFSDAHCDEVIDRLRKAGLVGDDQFARQWVDNRITFRPRSRRLVAAELRQKGVAEESIEQALDELPGEDHLAYDAAKRVAMKWSHLDREAFHKKLVGHLARKGFGYEAISSVVRQIWDEIREEQRST